MTVFGISRSRRTVGLLILLGLGAIVLAWVLRRRRTQRQLAWSVPDKERRTLYPPDPAPESQRMIPSAKPAPAHSIFTRRRIGAALIVLALIALAYLWWSGGNVTPKDPTLATSTPVPESLRYGVDAENSSLGVTVESRIGTVNGTFKVEQGVIELVPVANGLRVIANIKIDGASLDVGSSLINATLRRALQLEEYPTGVYSAESKDVIPAEDGTYQVMLIGRVELRGVQQDVEVDSTITRQGEQITLTALMPINVTNFGVSVPSLLASDVLDTNLLIFGSRGDPSPQPSVTPANTPAGTPD